MRAASAAHLHGAVRETGRPFRFRGLGATATAFFAADAAHNAPTRCLLGGMAVLAGRQSPYRCRCGHLAANGHQTGIMIVHIRLFALLLALLAVLPLSPASAQFFLKSPELGGEPVTGAEPGIAIALPGATPVELRAGLVWTMRAALNVSALQCQFEPTLLTVPTYNAILIDHKDELAAAFTALTNYYKRTNKLAKTALAKLDQYGTKVYSSFSTTQAQYIFCQTAASVGRDAIFTPRGAFWTLAAARMRELRNALVPRGEQAFPGRISVDTRVALPRLDPRCWNRRGDYDRRCGVEY